MSPRTGIPPRTYRAFTQKSIDRIPQIVGLPREEMTTLKAVSLVLPFRVNEYVLEELIDWKAVPDDPIYQLTFPQEGMLDPGDFRRMVRLVETGASEAEMMEAIREIQMDLNPHPAGQLELNVPKRNGRSFKGMQHKYGDTVLFFPSQGQTCHAYCSYCFRWAQFVGIDELKFASREANTLVSYLREHREVQSVLFTGGDPLIMKTRVLRRYVEPLLSPGLEHVTSIRIGTKAPAYWPYRFVTDADADDLLRLFEEVRQAGKHLALMAHYSHPRELEPEVARTALRRILDTGAVVRTQAPLIRNVNDDPEVWAEMWKTQYRLGAIPYYMFVERETGAKDYFQVPLARAYRIFRNAFVNVTGLARTVRGPVMSASPGKVKLSGTARVGDEKVFVLEFLRARKADWVGRPFFARFDPKATWLDQLEPAFGRDRFFWESSPREPRGLLGLLPDRTSELGTRWGQRPVSQTASGRTVYRDPRLDR